MVSILQVFELGVGITTANLSVVFQKYLRRKLVSPAEYQHYHIHFLGICLLHRW